MDNLNDKGYLKDMGLDRRIIFKKVLKQKGGRVWTGFIRLRMDAIGGVLYTFGYHKMRRISPLPEGLIAGSLLIFCRTFLVLKLTFTLVLTLYELFGWYVTAVPNQFGVKCLKVLQIGKDF